MSDLTRCPVCLDRLKIPKTLSCLHSFCSVCLSNYVARSQAPHTCPICRTPFVTPSDSTLPELSASSFISNLLLPEEEEVDPNELICEICEQNDAEWLCRQCKQYLCQSCKGLHLKTRATAFHNIKSLEEALGSEWRKIRASTDCPIHPGFEKKLYCKTCETPTCMYCITTQHNKHEFEILEKMSVQIREELSSHEAKAKERLALLQHNVATLEESLKICYDSTITSSQQIQDAFRALRAEVDAQEEKLKQRLNDSRRNKEMQIKLQKNDLEPIDLGLVGATQFATSLLREATEVEFAENSKLVLSRLKNLQSIPFDSNIPLEGPIEFFPDHLEPLKQAIQAFGSVDSNATQTDSEHCKAELIRKEKTFLRLQRVDFQITAHDFEGRQINKGGDRFIAEVTVPANSEPVGAMINDNKDGTYLGYFIPVRLGIHKISIRVRGKEIPDSPLNVEVAAVDYQILTVPSMEFGSKGSTDGSFDSPRAVTCNSKNQIIVADTNNHRIQVFDRDGNFLFKFGEKGDGAGQLNGPYGVAVDESNRDRIIVSDTQNNRIQIFDNSGKFIRAFGTRGSAEGEFSFPFGVAVDKQGRIAVADQTNHRIQIFNSEGVFIQKFGNYGTGPGQLNGPMGIAFDSKGNVVVAEHLNFRLQKFSPQGEYIRVLGNWQLKNPYHLVIDEQDQILVSDFGNSMIRVFDKEDQIFHSFGNQTGIPFKPTGIGIDKTGRVLVCERDSNKILVF